MHTTAAGPRTRSTTTTIRGLLALTAVAVALVVTTPTIGAGATTPAVACSASTPKLGCEQLVVDGLTRKVFYHQSPEPAPAAGRPLVLFFHGDGGTGNIEHPPLYAQTDPDAALVVQLDGPNNIPALGRGGTAWSFFMDGTAPDDVKFTKTVLDGLLANTLIPGNSIDPNRIYVMGASRGGFMVDTLLVDARTAGYFAGAVNLFGGFYCEDGDLVCNARINGNGFKTNVPILHMHGNDDGEVDPPAHIPNPVTDPIDWPYPLAQFADATGCSPTFDHDSQIQPPVNGQPTYLWVPSGNCAIDYRLVLIANTGHGFSDWEPYAWTYLRGIGVTPPAPAVASRFHPLVPARLLDSRTDVGGWSSSPLTASVSRPLTVTNVGGVPATATSVVLNVTATASSNGSFLTVYPAGTTRPNASNLNFGAGETIPNLVTVKVGTGGQIRFANAIGDVDVVADVVGYFAGGATGDLFTGLAPARILDSRTPLGGWDSTKIGEGEGNIRALTVAGAGGVPPAATSVVMNVTATDSDAGSFLQVWPAGAARPNSSNLNFGAGQTIPNLVVVQLGAGGAVSFFNAVGNAHVVADVVGYFDPGGGARYFGLGAPNRILDDREGVGLDGPWGPGADRALPVTGTPGIPPGATGVIMNTTVTNGTQGSFVTVHPDGTAVPNASNLNFGAGQTIPNLVMAQLPGNGTTRIYNKLGSVDVIADAVGYFAP